MTLTRENIFYCVWVLLLGAALLAFPYTQAYAADAKNKQERAAQRRLQQMQQQFQQEKAALEQENATLKEQLKKGEAKLASSQKALAKQRQETSTEIAEKDTQLAAKDEQLAVLHRDMEAAQLAARNELAARQQKLDETTQSLQKSEALNKQLNADKARLGIELTDQKSEVYACQLKNNNLINMSRDMASKCEKAALKGIEPFTGIQGVAIENQYQDVRDQADAQIYKPKK